MSQIVEPDLPHASDPKRALERTRQRVPVHRPSRVRVRKWIVRRSDLERMLAATNVVVETDPVTPEVQDLVAVQSRAAAAPATDAQSAVALLQIANDRFADAIEVSAYVPPAPGYIGRLRRLADSCEHMASTLLNAATLAGIRWSPRPNFGLEVFPYEVRAGGNRPGAAELWRDVDAGLERLVIAVTGTEVSAVAHSFREAGAALEAVADELERDESWQVGSRAG